MNRREQTPAQLLDLAVAKARDAQPSPEHVNRSAARVLDRLREKAPQTGLAFSAPVTTYPLRDWGWLTPTIVGAVIVALFIVGELIFFRPLTPINDKASGIDLAPAPPQNGLAPIQTAPIFTAPIETAPVTVAPIEPPPINPAPIVQPDVDDVLNSLRGRRPRESAPAPAPNAGTRSTARGRGAPPTDILNSESELIERACAGCHPATLVRNYAMRRGADQPTRQDFENLLAQENARGAGLTDTEVSRLLNWFSRLRTLNMRGGRGAAPCIIAPDENCTVTP